MTDDLATQAEAIWPLGWQDDGTGGAEARVGEAEVSVGTDDGGQLLVVCRLGEELLLEGFFEDLRAGLEDVRDQLAEVVGEVPPLAGAAAGGHADAPGAGPAQ
jgi:hypothetical protein